MIRRLLAAIRGPKPWSKTWTRVVAWHMWSMEQGTGYRRTLPIEEIDR